MLLIKNATIYAPGSSHHGKKRDLLIKKGLIELIRAKIEEPKAKVLEAKGLCVSPGWLDLGVQVGDPGFEHREDLQSVTRAAAAGGFTAIAAQPNTQPTIHSKSEVTYLKNHSTNNLVDIFPLGALSESCAGKDITEMYDMHQAGAVAFSDGKNPVQDSGLMMRALLYVKAFDGLVINSPQDAGIAGKGQMHEGVMSTTLGLKGIPALAEELMLIRDINLLDYTGSRLHVANISTAGAVVLVRQAKTNGLRISASVPAINLALSDEVLEGFDSNYKVLPPLREMTDIKALRKALKSGTIEIITSNHIPYDGEAKDLEFPYAKFGIIGLETVFPLVNTHLQDTLSIEEMVKILAINPRKLLGLEVPQIEEGEIANLTLFNTDEEWTYAKKDIFSKSSNTPFVGTVFKGKVIGIINKGQTMLR